jgi:hypothetical protein
MNAASRGHAAVVALLLVHSPNLQLQVGPPPSQCLIAVMSIACDAPMPQARNGSTALHIARAHGRLHVQMLLESHAQWEAVACAVAAAALRFYELPPPRYLRWKTMGAAIELTAAAAGLQSVQRIALLRSSSCALLLIMRLATRREAAVARSARKLPLLVARRCIGGAFARWLLRERALKTQADAAWQHAQGGGDEMGGKERCYGD